MNEKLLLIISLIFNFVLVLSLFFKSALNDILRESWINKQKTKKENERRLVDLRANLEKLKANYPLMLAYTTASRVQNDSAIHQQLILNLNSSSQIVHSALDVISKDEIYYPKEVRQLFNGIKNTVGEYSKEVIRSSASRDRLMEITSDIQACIDNLTRLIENQLDAI